MRVVGVRDVDGTVGETNVRPLREKGWAVGVGLVVAAAAGAAGLSGAAV